MSDNNAVYTQAQSYCANCSMGYCDSCLQKHNRNALFQNHKVRHSIYTPPADGPDVRQRNNQFIAVL